MKTESKSNRNLKGAVLLTVVSVLAIMIIFMTCTLALASAANKRSRKSYSSSQSTYTARATIDSILAAVGKDTNFSQAIRQLGEGEEMTVIVDLPNYSMGTVTNAKIKRNGTKDVFDPETGSWTTRNLFIISADVTIGGETTTIRSNILQDAPVDDSGGGGGAAFLTYGGDIPCGNFVSSWGGCYFGMGEWTKNGKIGLWNKQLKFIEWDSEGGKLITLANKEYLTGKSYNFKDINAVEAPFVVNGNFDVSTKLSVYYTYLTKGIENPGVQIWGDLSMKNGDEFAVRLSDALETKLKNGTAKINSFLEIPYLYVDGNLRTGTQGIIGLYGSTGTTPSNLPFNVFCGSYDDGVNGGVGVEFRGDVYCMDSEKTSTFKGGKTLYKWTGSVINGGNGYNLMGGSLYSKGNVVFTGGKTVEGNVMVEGDFEIQGDTTINGDLVVGGVLVTNGKNLTVKGNVYVDKTAGSDAKKMKPGYTTETEDILKIVNVRVNYGDHVQTPDYFYGFESDIPALEQALGYKPTVKNGQIDFNNHEFTGAQWQSIQSRYLKNSNNEKKTLYKNPEGVIVSESEAFDTTSENAAGKTIGGKAAKPVKDYTEPKGGQKRNIYPEIAERENLMGVSWPVKGIEYRVIDKDELPAEIDFDNKAAYPQFDGTNDLKNRNIGTIDCSCTLTGTFTDTVKIKTRPNEDIYIRLLDVNFESKVTEDEDGKKQYKNNAKIVVDDTAPNSKVKFVLDGSYITSNYYYKDEKSDTKLLKTVYDWMDQFSLENKAESPTDEPVAGMTDQALSKPLFSDSLSTVKLTGTWSRDIHIQAPATGSVWVVLDNFELASGNRIIIDDVGADGKKASKGMVKFYLKGKNHLRGGSHIVEQSFINLAADASPTNPIYMFSSNANIANLLPAGKTLDDIKDRMYLPYVKFFSEKDSVDANGKVTPVYTSLECDANVMMTGYFHAINLDTDLKKGSQDICKASNIVYDGQRLGTGTNPSIEDIGLIGMLDVRSVKGTGGNEWTMLYVDDSDIQQQNTTVVDAEGKHTYSAVEYFAYTN